MPLPDGYAIRYALGGHRWPEGVFLKPGAPPVGWRRADVRTFTVVWGTHIPTHVVYDRFEHRCGTDGARATYAGAMYWFDVQHVGFAIEPFLGEGVFRIRPFQFGCQHRFVEVQSGPGHSVRRCADCGHTVERDTTG